MCQPISVTLLAFSNSVTITEKHCSGFTKLSHLEVIDGGVRVVVLGEERVERAEVPSGERRENGDHNWAAAMHCVGLSAARVALGPRLKC